MPTFISPDGNREVWDVKPPNYMTEEEFAQSLSNQPTNAIAEVRAIEAQMARINIESLPLLRKIALDMATPDDVGILEELEVKYRGLVDSYENTEYVKTQKAVQERAAVAKEESIAAERAAKLNEQTKGNNRG